ncbi:JAB domain-containing protein [Gilvimarinus sp. SDUM040013]|uniref:JAB domain-containing protein n=1 Tax=Gilvimarinus gilvus TaxID=3058038 RepID=A0ABU4S595_9GAMM|nr:JAB domain-containing protein [Gilvimarinus sp. SDUM040013]MDO3386025.1 JAB domain-containing protein [Gilvimarinus sp. SDUM040013]MDX6850479.1 JAB domain-containing protein [Gilvimarinus sp. SDUM040013]
MSYDRYKKIDKRRVIDSPKKAIAYVKAHSIKTRERMLFCLYLDDNLQPCFFDAYPDEMQMETATAQRDILRKAIQLGIEKVVIVTMLDLENSQVGDPLQDQYELVEALNVAGIEALDHVIMTPVGFMEATRSVITSVKRSWRKVRRLPAPAAA